MYGNTSRLVNYIFFADRVEVFVKSNTMHTLLRQCGLLYIVKIVMVCYERWKFELKLVLVGLWGHVGCCEEVCPVQFCLTDICLLSVSKSLRQLQGEKYIIEETGL